MVGDLYLYYMKPFEKFLESNSSVRELLDTYLALRLHLQELGFSEKDLENVPMFTPKMMSLQDRFTNQKNALFRLVKDYGFDIGDDELVAYFIPLLKKINDITPLSNVDYKRDDPWYKDNQRD